MADDDNPLASDGPAGASWLSQSNPLVSLNAGGNPLGDTVAPPPAQSPPNAFSSAKALPSGQLDDASARQAVLNKIASGEANSYNETYGGAKPGSFSDFSDHPRQRVPIPGSPGQTSDAAGLYQFLSSTWDTEKNKLGLKDFSPASQDEAAWDYASTSYKQNTGRDLLNDAKAGNVHWSALSKQWPSLASSSPGPGLPSRGAGAGAQIAQPGGNSSPGAIPQNPSDQSAQLKGLMQLALIQAAFPQHKFTPIDYDPWKVRPVVGGPVQ